MGILRVLSNRHPYVFRYGQAGKLEGPIGLEA
jgi:hypothetical protein